MLPRNELLADLCFPDEGVAADARTFLLPQMHRELRDACFGTPDARNTQWFVFMLNRTLDCHKHEPLQQEDLYGIVIWTREPILWRPDGDHLTVMTTPRAYCLLSKWPVFEMHFECLARISQAAAELQFKALLSKGQHQGCWSAVPMPQQLKSTESILRRCERSVPTHLGLCESSIQGYSAALSQITVLYCENPTASQCLCDAV